MSPGINPNMFPNLFLSGEEQKFVGNWGSNIIGIGTVELRFRADYFILKRMSFLIGTLSIDDLSWRVEGNELIIEGVLPQDSSSYHLKYYFTNNTLNLNGVGIGDKYDEFHRL
jgi:hypothetical protein